jgi:transposase
MKDNACPAQPIPPSLPVVGLDIAKASFDAVLLLHDATSTMGLKPRYKRFPNTAAGFSALRQWLAHGLEQSMSEPRDLVHACMEATGPYFEALAVFLHEYGHTVSVVNPRRIQAYAQSKLLRTKTDRVDAHLIADFCATQRPRSWQPLPPDERTLQVLTRHLEALKGARCQHENQRQMLLARCPEVERSLEAVLAVLDEQIAAIASQMEQHVEQTPSLREALALLTTIPGIGRLSAAQILSEVPQLRQFSSARAVAAYAGLVPAQRQSGTSVRGRAQLSKLGNARLRKALYMPALSALRWNPVVRALKARLSGRGKRPKQVVVACMRKLLQLCYGVLKSGRPFEAKYALNA